MAASSLAPQFCKQFLRLNSWPFWQNSKTAWMRRHSTFASSAVEASEFEFVDEIYDDIKAKEKETALQTALSQLSGDFGRESMLSLRRFFCARRAPVVSTGSLRLDQALGTGGLPRGRMVEIYGQEASGKTTLALHIIKEAQKLGGYCAYLDVENAMNPSLAESIGVDLDNLLISQPNSAESLLSMVDTLTKSGAISVIVVDSVAALVPQLELDSSIVGSSKDIRSEIMTKAVRKIHYSLCLSNTLLLFINQVRSNHRPVQHFRNSDDVTSGGNALRFYAAVRMRLIRKRLLKTENSVIGLAVCAQVVKNKLAPAMTTADLSIHFGRGICCESEILELACEHGVVVKDGASYLIEDILLDGKEEAENYLASNSRIQDNIVGILRSRMFCRGW